RDHGGWGGTGRDRDADQHRDPRGRGQTQGTRTPDSAGPDRTGGGSRSTRRLAGVGGRLVRHRNDVLHRWRFDASGDIAVDLAQSKSTQASTGTSRLAPASSRERGVGATAYDEPAEDPPRAVTRTSA